MTGWLGRRWRETSCLAAAVALGLVVWVYGRPTRPDVRDAATLTISVPGVPGPYCMYGIEKRLREIAPTAQIALGWRENELHVSTGDGATLASATLRDAVRRAQYPGRYSIGP